MKLQTMVDCQNLLTEFAYLICRNGDTWRIKKDHVLPYRRPSKQK